MKTSEMFQEVLSENKPTIKSGKLTEKILLELRMMTSVYDHIEILNNHYSDEENYNRNNWTDVEGMGYGWRWLRYEEEEERWHEMMAKMVGEEADKLSRKLHDHYFVVYEKDDIHTYHFITNDDWRIDIIVHFSTKELSY